MLAEIRIESLGAISAATLAAIESAMSKKYGRSVKARAESNPALLAGMRVHVGDDTQLVRCKRNK